MALDDSDTPALAGEMPCGREPDDAGADDNVIGGP
jgi:hypothetical protein